VAEISYKRLNIDWITVVVYFLLVIAGWLNIYSAVYSDEHRSIFDIEQRYGKQLIWIVCAFVLALFTLIVDSKFYAAFAYWFYGFFIILLIGVLFLGRMVNGSKSWFMIGNFALQPAEFAKLGTALAISKLIGSFNFKFTEKKLLLALIGIILLPVLLIVFQHDTGSALVYASFVIAFFREGLSGLILFFVLLLGGLFIFSLVASPLTVLVSIIAMAFLAYYVIRKNINEIGWSALVLAVVSLLVWGGGLLFNGGQVSLYFIFLRSSLISGVILLLFAIYRRIPQAPLIASIFLMTVLYSTTVDFVFDKVLEPHQQARINNLLGVESDPLGAGYNVNQSKIAIGSGGFWGKGFLKGTQTKYDFVPEQSTDFIFCTVGEEWGFVGSIAIIGAFLFLLVRIVTLAERQRSVFSRVYGYCVASIFFFHFAVNVGMTIGLAPVIGIPLPFFSYGGSSLWFFTVLLFVFLRLDSSRLELLR
jgi:rod shape determining protein RodA